MYMSLFSLFIVHGQKFLLLPVKYAKIKPVNVPPKTSVRWVLDMLSTKTTNTFILWKKVFLTRIQLWSDHHTYTSTVLFLSLLIEAMIEQKYWMINELAVVGMQTYHHMVVEVDNLCQELRLYLAMLMLSAYYHIHWLWIC